MGGQSERTDTASRAGDSDVSASGPARAAAGRERETDACTPRKRVAHHLATSRAASRPSVPVRGRGSPRPSKLARDVTAPRTR